MASVGDDGVARDGLPPGFLLGLYSYHSSPSCGAVNIQDLPRPVSLSAFDDLLIWGTVRLTRRAGALSIVGQEAAWADSGLEALELHHALPGRNTIFPLAWLLG